MIGVALRTALLRDAAVAALVGTRVYPIGNLPQAPATDTTKWPAISYQSVGGAPETQELSGETYQQEERVQVDCWASTYDAAQELARVAKEALRKARGGEFGGQRVKSGTLIPSPDDYESETKLHRASFDWKVIFKEEVA